MELKNELEQIFNIKIINLYGYGSVYYGTSHENSDMDFKVICDTDKHIELSNRKYNLQIHSVEEFIDQLNNKHNVGFIEAYHNPIYIEINIEFIFVKDRLKHAITAICDNAYCKAKKKLINDAIKAKNEMRINDMESHIYFAKKSLFHSIRIFDFGIQLCHDNGKIVDWKHMKSLYDNIMELPTESLDEKEWKIWEGRYKKMYKEYKTKFWNARHNINNQ